MTISNVVLPLFGLVFVLLTFFANSGHGAPPRDKEIIGSREWAETGTFATEYAIDDDKFGHELVFPGRHDGYNRVSASLSFTLSPDKSRPLLRFGTAGGVIPIKSALYSDSTNEAFLVKQYDVFPIYGHIYTVMDGAKSIVLSRVTDKVPEVIRPARNSRTIAMNAHNPTLFWEQDAASKTRPRAEWVQYYDVVKIAKIDRKTLRATIELTPMVRPNKRSLTSERMPLTLEVGQGELLTARGRSYRVLNIVPSQDIGLVGWIEISADPVETDEKKTPEP